MTRCFACEKPMDDSKSSVDVTIRMGTSSESASIPYCESCVKKIHHLDRDVLLDGVEQHIEHLIAGIPKTPISISEKEVRIIAGNLGATEKVEEALIERIFGKDWNGPPPKDSGLVMNRYTNRDRLVAFVATKLKDLWTLES